MSHQKNATNPPQYSIELTLSTLMLAVMRLRNTYKYDEVAPKPFNDEMDIAYHKAETELNQLIYTQVLELIPEKVDMKQVPYQKDIQPQYYVAGFNQAIDDMTERIKAKYIGKE